ncbi:MAG TPA: hypothetical protein VFZ77_13910 [Acidimicrobiales bacterium]
MVSDAASDGLARSDGDTVTPGDIVGMNGMAVARTAAFTRIAGSALVGVGAVGAAAWLWVVVRAQSGLSELGASIFGQPRDLSLAARVDVIAGAAGLLVSAALTAGAGLALRLAADYAVARTGGSVTGFQVGDPLIDVAPEASGAGWTARDDRHA